MVSRSRPAWLRPDAEHHLSSYRGICVIRSGPRSSSPRSYPGGFPWSKWLRVAEEPGQELLDGARSGCRRRARPVRAGDEEAISFIVASRTWEKISTSSGASPPSSAIAPERALDQPEGVAFLQRPPAV